MHSSAGVDRLPIRASRFWEEVEPSFRLNRLTLIELLCKYEGTPSDDNEAWLLCVAFWRLCIFCRLVCVCVCALSVTPKKCDKMSDLAVGGKRNVCD